MNLEDLARLESSSTPGPWHADSEKDDDDRRQFFLVFGTDQGLAIGDGNYSNAVTSDWVHCEDDRYVEMWTNLRLAAEARNALPYLLTEVRRLREIIGRDPMMAAVADENTSDPLPSPLHPREGFTPASDEE